MCAWGTGTREVGRAGVGREERERRGREGQRETKIEGEYGREGGRERKKRVREEGRGMEEESEREGEFLQLCSHALLTRLIV